MDLFGPDLSHHNGHCDFHAIKAGGASFVALKASEHVSEDPLFDHNLAAAKSAGLPVMPYHFYRPDGDAGAQVSFFLNLLKERNGGLKGLITPAIDIELDSNERTMPAADYVHGVEAWLDDYKAEVGREPVGYSYKDMWQWMGSPVLSGKLRAWVAEYVSVPYTIAGFCTPKSLAFWQHTDHGSCAGVPGAGQVDMNYFNGDLVALKALIL